MTEPKRPLKVFLSYASQDRPLVRELSRQLVDEGWIDTWVDEKSLLPGQDWRVKIEEAVEEADVVIICLSNHSVSKEGYVQKELRYAREIALEKPEETIFLIPLRLDECDVPRGLRFYQWVNYFGDAKNNSYDALVKSLKLRYEQKIRLEEIEHSREEQARLEAEELARRKAEKEKVEREVGEKAAREKAEQRAYQLALLRKNIRRPFAFLKSNIAISPSKLRIASFIGIAVTVLGLGIWSVQKLDSSIPTKSPTATITSVLPTKTLSSISIYTKAMISIPTVMTATKTSLPSLTPTEFITYTPTSLPTQVAKSYDPNPDSSDYIDTFGVPMRFVSPGEFTMGSDTGRESERPAHKVYLDAFYIDKYEVTNILYKICEAAGACPQAINLSMTSLSYHSQSKYNNYPVMTSWEGANAYCNWRGARLPTEAEWEKSARGVDGRTFPWGEGISCANANYNYCNPDAVSGYTTEATTIGSYTAGKSVYGLYDMAGNVAEWVLDWYSSTYYLESPLSNPLGPLTGTDHVKRGGSATQSKDLVTTFDRSDFNDFTAPGFRCARDANP